MLPVGTILGWSLPENSSKYVGTKAIMMKSC